MNKNKEIEKLKQVLMERVKLTNDSRYMNLLSDEIMKIIIDASLSGKYSLWIIREYLKGNIQRFEDIESRCKQALTLFKNNLSKFDKSQKQLNKISFQELETLVSPYQDVLTQNEIKRMNKEKIWSEIDVVYDGPEYRVYIPRTEQASIFLGQGTKWCTAAANNNMFNYYNSQGPLYVFVLPEKDKNGREVKYQFHFRTNQFMDSEDENIRETIKNKLISQLFWSVNSEQKIKFLLNNDVFFDFFWGNNEFSGVMENIVCEKIKTGNLSPLRKIPDKQKTKKMFELAVAESGTALCYVPIDLRTLKLCKMAVRQNACSLKYVPQDLKKPEIFEFTVSKNGLNLEHIQKEYQNTKLYEIAVKQNGMSLEHVPEISRTKKICETAVKKNGMALKYVPKDLITLELCEIAISHNGYALQYVPENFKSKKNCEMAVKQNGAALRYVPLQFKTHEFCDTAVRQNGHALEYVPLHMMNYKICEIAVKQNGACFEIIPEEFKTKELALMAVKQNGIALSSIKFYESFLNDEEMYELCKIAVKNNPHAIRYLPSLMRTVELCETAIEKDFNVIYYVPAQVRTQEFIKKSLENILEKNNLSHTFEDAVKMIFDQKSNSVKELIGFQKEYFIDFYFNIVTKEINEILCNQLTIKKILHS